jgi:hypothetical protein
MYNKKHLRQNIINVILRRCFIVGLTIAVQEGLPEIEAMLEQNGFHVVSLEHSKEPVSAIVYSGVAETWEGMPSIENYAGTDPIGNQGPRGTVLVNTTGYTPQEVVELLNTRLASRDNYL